MTHAKRKLEENDLDNYIKVKYKKDATYSYGFSIIEHDKSENQYRSDIYLINNNNTSYQPNEALTIKKNTEITIVFNSAIKSLNKFFYDYYDPNVEYISSIDLTHFDSSLIESLEGSFYGCISVESIDLSTFTAPSLNNMAQTFFHCSSLKVLDLSKLNSSLITNTNRMFCGCESLLYINMNNLDLSHVDNATYMFYNMKEINYLEIKGLKVSEKIEDKLNGEYGLNDKENLIVCKNEENLSIGKYESICCKYDIELKKSGNYIICKYKETTEYENGFQNEYRTNVSHIINKNAIVNPNEKFIIEANSTIEIHFSEPINSLRHFFMASEFTDPKSQNIIFIDLSHFDSSSLEDTNSMFSQCSSLEEFNFTNFNTSKVTNMGYMFF